jgi:hypothetical protein
MSDMEKNEHVDLGVITTSAANSTKDFDVSGLSDPEKALDGSTKAAELVEATDAKFQYVTGVKLWLATSAVTLVCFLMMLDMSIIVTVSYDPLLNAVRSLIYVGRLFLELPPTFIRWAMLVGTAAHIFWQSM